MRLGEWMQAASSSVPWMLLALVANPAAAQFREVQPGDDPAAIEIRLTPTRENFVPPRLQPVPEGQPTPAAATLTGTPTLAELPAVAQPAPGLRIAARPTGGRADPTGRRDARRPGHSGGASCFPSP